MNPTAQLPAFCAALCCAAAAVAQDPAANNTLHVVFVGDLDTDRSRDFTRFLREHFPRVDAVRRQGCTPDRLRTADVVLLDWPRPQGEPTPRAQPGRKHHNPLGELHRWNRPTVLLGSAGLHVADDWGLPGTVGTADLLPQAYAMQEHVMWRHPHSVAVRATVDISTPRTWRQALGGSESVAVLPIATQTAQQPGWCTANIEINGPELEVVCGGHNGQSPTHAAVWRQGNLLHFGFGAPPTQLNRAGRGLLLNGIDYISRFVEDRPIVRLPARTDNLDAPRPRITGLEQDMKAGELDGKALGARFCEPWRTRLAALDDNEAREFLRNRRKALAIENGALSFSQLAIDLDIDLTSKDAPTRLAAQFGTARHQEAEALLLRLLPEGPGQGTTGRKWRQWIRARQRYLCHDPHSLAFRLDPVAQWRRQPSADLRGARRSSGNRARSAEAIAIAARAVAFHGGDRALDDLRSFSCRVADVYYLWDRDQGMLRIENHLLPKLEAEQPKSTTATDTVSWHATIFDTAANADVVDPDLPPPPFSGRGFYRQLVERLFLPLLLLEPGASIALLEDDEDGNQRLSVRMAGHGLDPRKTHVLHIAPTGEVLAIDYGASAASRSNIMTVKATTKVGPLVLPTSFDLNSRRINRALVYEAAQWNPTVPAEALTSTELILGDK